MAAEANATLKRLGYHVFGRKSLPDSDLSKFSDRSYAGTPLIPSNQSVVLSDELFEVRRAVTPSNLKTRTGIDGFRDSIDELTAFWNACDDKRFEIKLTRALEDGEELETRVMIAASGKSSEGMVEQHADWTARWTRSSDSGELKLASLVLTDFEQTLSKQTLTLFSDCTASVLEGNASFPSQLRFGINHWLLRNQDMRYFSALGNPGMAVGDVNNDGLDDLYLCQEANLPNRLFLQQPDGTVLDVSAAWGVDYLQGSRSAMLLDFDNDGDQDLAVAIMGGVVFASNENGRFEIKGVVKTDDDTTSISAADYDLDGDLDIYVCVDYPNERFSYANEISQVGSTVQGGAANRVYHDANNAGRNSLFRNEIDANGNWSFVDVTDQVGLDANNERFSWSACWEDYDDDGDQDLYVANDFGRNNLYENQNGRFVDRAQRSGVENAAAGMSAAWGDVNRDGQMDIYVSNMFSSAGHRITEQPQFKQDLDQEVKQRWRNFSLGNALFRNEGNGQFQSIEFEAGVNVGRWAWSSNFLDINNDGWQDIAVANGYITTDDSSDL